MADGERGQASILMLGLCVGAIALGMIMSGVGSWYVKHAELQQAADVAAASMQQPRGDDPVSHARTLARANGATRVRFTADSRGRRQIVVSAPGPHVVGVRVSGRVTATAMLPEVQLVNPWSGGGAPGMTAAGNAHGGAYAGPLVRVDGVLICPRVGAEYVDMQRSAALSGVQLRAVSGFRTYAEQAALYAQLGPGIAAPPGSSLHHQATEFDLAVGGAGSPVHRWLTMNASRYHFIQRYSWEPWHWGNVRGC